MCPLCVPHAGTRRGERQSAWDHVAHGRCGAGPSLRGPKRRHRNGGAPSGSLPCRERRSGKAQPNVFGSLPSCRGSGCGRRAGGCGGFASRMRRGRRARISFRSPSKTTALPGDGMPCPRRLTRFSRHCVRTNGAARPGSSRAFQGRPAGSRWMCGPNSAGGIKPAALSKALRRTDLRKSGLDASQPDAGGCIMAPEGRYPAAGRRVSSLPDVGGRRVPKGALGHFFLGEAS